MITNYLGQLTFEDFGSTIYPVECVEQAFGEKNHISLFNVFIFFWGGEGWGTCMEGELSPLTPSPEYAHVFTHKFKYK